ncbi:MAG: glycosyltransferase, partial [Alphaproteobacteria bacterium]
MRRPLLWIYNVFFERYVARSNARYAIYHATENYFLDDDQWSVSDGSVRAPLTRVLARVDLVVGVSEPLTQTYRNLANYSGKAITLANGCDFAFWREQGAAEHDNSAGKVALFQGGINARLDYPLLIELAQHMPEWRFWYCGHIKDAGAQWGALSALPNVEYKGELSPEQIAKLAKQATAGLIPFLQGPLTRQSLPLKAYEYVACGLPVVSVAIDELQGQPQLFAIAETAAEFAQKLHEVAPTRSDPEFLEIRREAGSRQSYDERFAELSRTIAEAVALRPRKKIRLNIVVLYDDGSTHVKTVFEHLEAFQKYSRHDVFMMPITSFVETDGLDFSPFDAVIIHYSVRVSIPDHIFSPIASIIARYDGPKILFAQDEYEGTETARAWIESLGVDAVFTNVPMDEIEKVYPRSRFPMVDFVPTLTGYVPEDAQIDDFALPLAERKTLIAYRGRM